MTHPRFTQRIRSRHACFALLFMGMLLPGCRSPEPTFVTIDPVSSGADRGAVLATPIAIGEITLPPEADRRSLIIRRDTSRVALDPVARWAAPLDEIVKSALRANLVQRLPTGSVLGPAQPLDATEANVLTLAMQTFSADAEGRVRLDATWRLLNADGESLLTREQSIETPAAGE